MKKVMLAALITLTVTPSFAGPATDFWLEISRDGEVKSVIGDQGSINGCMQMKNIVYKDLEYAYKNIHPEGWVDPENDKTYNLEDWKLNCRWS